MDNSRKGKQSCLMQKGWLAKTNIHIYNIYTIFEEIVFISTFPEVI